MTKTATALYNFWSSFGIPAWVEYHVPDDAEMPYITYELTDPNWKEQAAIRARVWYRDFSFERISAKLDEIKEKIGDGYTMAVDDGMIAIFTDDPFIQFQPYEDETGVKVAYLSCILNAFV